MNHHIQKDSGTGIAGVAAVEVLLQDDAIAIPYDSGFDAKQWQRYIEREIGFVLPSIQRHWLENAVNQTALSYGLTTEKLWYQLPNNNALRQQLLDKVLIHESRFFRHPPSIDFIADYAEQYQRQHYQNENDDSRAAFRIWSVGCASGQETWSLAMRLASKQLGNYKILGTDVSQQALATARLGRYDTRQQLLIPEYCQQFIQPLPPKSINNALDFNNTAINEDSVISSQTNWQITPILKPQVRFALHNIMDKTPPVSHLQQVIVCQNMLLYFRKFDQRDILTRLSEQCALGGYIILAPGEALFWRPSNMRRLAHPQINAWQKISA